MKKLSPVLMTVCAVSMLSACVSQNYENDKNTPIIENESSNNEIAMTRIQLGLGYLKMGNTQQAKLNLEKAKRFSPNLVQVHTAFAHYYDSVDEPALAIKSYEHALSINPNDADTLNNYGVFLCRQQEFDKAEKQILKAVAIPSYILVAQSYENLALCQLKAERFTKAEGYLEKAIAHSPNRASSLLQMMQLQYAKSDYKMAQNYLYRYEKSTRRFSAQALALAFKIYQKQGNNRIAKNYANMLVKMFPSAFETKQYILNELYRIEADKIADAYQASLGGGSKKPKKRVVMLSPKNTPQVTLPNKEVTGDLSRNGLQPIMENSVMKTAQQKSEQAKVVEPSKTVENTPKLEQAASQKAGENVTVSTQAALETTTNLVDKKTTNMAMVSLPVHVVKKGDSLFSISRQYNIVMKSLVRWNKLRKPYLLKIGDVVYLANPKASQKEQN